LKFPNTLIATIPICFAVAGCATQSKPIATVESIISDSEQQAAQESTLTALQVPRLKRKLALGRITNETKYGQSLLRKGNGDPLGKQVSDILSKALTESDAYLVFERPDISTLQAESDLVKSDLNLIGVDTLVIGSLTEFGRKTIGEIGFVSSTKKQIAFAKVDLRLVDAKTGLVYASVSGAGEASTEAGSVLGFGSTAEYDGTLNDGAIRVAVSEAVSKLVSQARGEPWRTDVLSVEDARMIISGGKSQGISRGMTFDVMTLGKKVKSNQTGGVVTLPGQKLAELKIESTFGTNELDEGSVGRITSGSITGNTIESLEVIFTEEGQ